MKRFFQWLALCEFSVVMGVVVLYTTNGLGLGGVSIKMLGSMALLFQIYVVSLAAMAKGTPWPFKT